MNKDVRPTSELLAVKKKFVKISKEIEDLKSLIDEVNNKIPKPDDTISKISARLDELEICSAEHCKSIDELKKKQEEFAPILRRLDTLESSEETKVEVPPAPDFGVEITQLKDELKKVSKELLLRVNNLGTEIANKGGGSQNQRISVNSSVMSSRYADFNLIAGSGVTITKGDNNSTKQVDITLAASGAAGTVTSVSVTTANGVSGSVATPTVTPAITLTLGAITPTTIVASGAISGSNLSGTNTGDQNLAPYALTSSLATVATTGSYNDLTNKPSIATLSSSISLVNQTADIADTAFSVNTAGLYRIEFYLLDTTADITAGAVTLNIKYTDNAAARTISSSPVVLSALTGFAQGEVVIRLASGTCTYGVTHTGAFGTSVYALYLTQEKLI